MRRCSSFHSKAYKMGQAESWRSQLDLFDHSVIEHTVGASLFCSHHAPKARCMMIENNKVRKTYSQEWSAYNQAQTNEKSRFQELLFELCRNIEEPMQHMGRPRVPIADRIFACCFKVYSMLSGRRFTSDLQEATRRGYLSVMPHYNSMFRYLEGEDLTAILKQLIIESSLPLKCVEFDFAVDSSGFCTGQYNKWLHAKYGAVKVINKENWLKVHLMCGVKTNIVTSVEVTSRNAGDSPQFAHLVEQTSRNFVMNEVSADKAYSSSKNLQLVLVKGAQPYIAFRNNANATGKGQSVTWKRMYHLYRLCTKSASCTKSQ